MWRAVEIRKMHVDTKVSSENRKVKYQKEDMDSNERIILAFN
jgi:hypothetical protein